MIPASTRTISQPPYCVSGPLRNARHCRPSPWIRRLVSRPGMDAYCGFSLALSHDLGGLFQPGTAVEPCAGAGGDWALGASTFGASCFNLAPDTGAVLGGTGAATCASFGGALAPAFAPCAKTGAEAKKAAPTINA